MIGNFKVPVSILLPVFNEELNIRGALKSVTWADEIFVVDSQSTDKTVEIAGEYTDNIVQFKFDGKWPKKKNWSLENLPFGNEWVFMLDADERVTLELRDEIAEVIQSNEAEGYYVDRKFIFLGKPMRCFRPNWNPRLIKHRLGRYENLRTEDVPGTGDNEVHEYMILNGRWGYLKHPLIHDDQRTLRAWLDRHNRYSSWEAKVYYNFQQENLQFSPVRFLHVDAMWRKRMIKRLWVWLPFRPLLRFIWFYFVKGGVLDGKPGFIYCTLMGFYEFLISAKYYEMTQCLSRSDRTAKLG